MYPQAGDNSIHLRDINLGIVFRWGVINWDACLGEGSWGRWKLNLSGKDGSEGLVYALNRAAASICLGALCWNCSAAGGRRVSQWAPGAWVLLFCSPSISLWSLWACHSQLKLRCTLSSLCSWDTQTCRAQHDPVVRRGLLSGVGFYKPRLLCVIKCLPFITNKCELGYGHRLWVSTQIWNTLGFIH